MRAVKKEFISEIDTIEYIVSHEDLGFYTKDSGFYLEFSHDIDHAAKFSSKEDANSALRSLEAGIRVLANILTIHRTIVIMDTE